MHDELLWRSSDEVKQIACYQREFRTGAGFHNLSVFWIDDFRGVNDVLIGSVYGCDFNAVAWSETVLSGFS
jgi:hypothetical protein